MLPFVIPPLKSTLAVPSRSTGNLSVGVAPEAIKPLALVQAETRTAPSAIQQAIDRVTLPPDEEEANLVAAMISPGTKSNKWLIIGLVAVAALAIYFVIKTSPTAP